MTLQVREILGQIRNEEIIAKGSSIKIRKKLEKLYGYGNWKKMKGIAEVRLSDGSVKQAEIHWFEAHGIGKKNIKVKYYLGG
ncbi:Uncharacterized protein dnl_54620 [Desulfonema limicola]|uniref:Uncharacterized protein n=1 Tax=Desulfonema limicola TaxID=45656 RepID=A0A975GJ43_9BACT|nr:hypothetical protein [Desulfonema limicola]QTA83069.1 Uncharacterized protein dnl_54620 [Desulfonema limicola]